MSPKDFVNFLNGAIELGDLTNLNDKNFKIVNDKLSIIKVDTTPEGTFCNWLKGFLDAIEDKSLIERQFSKITEKLFDLNEKKSMNINDINIQANKKQNPYLDKPSKLPNSNNNLRC